MLLIMFIMFAWACKWGMSDFYADQWGEWNKNCDTYVTQQKPKEQINKSQGVESRTMSAKQSSKSYWIAHNF